MIRPHQPRRRRLTLLAGFVLATILVAIRPAPVGAGTAATLDCSNAVGNGAVGVLMPPPDVAVRTYVSQFWYRFDGVFSGTGQDWTRDPVWYFGDSSASFFWTDQTRQWQRLTPGSWTFHGVWNTGTVYVWESQYDFATQQWSGHNLGYCQTYQYTPFYPFPGV